MGKYMKTGLVFGTILFLFLGYNIYLHGWNYLYLIVYVFLTVLQLVVVSEESEENTFNFLTGLNLPTFVIVILLFKYVDFRNRNK